MTGRHCRRSTCLSFNVPPVASKVQACRYSILPCNDAADNGSSLYMLFIYAASRSLSPAIAPVHGRCFISRQRRAGLRLSSMRTSASLYFCSVISAIWAACFSLPAISSRRGTTPIFSSSRRRTASITIRLAAAPGGEIRSSCPTDGNRVCLTSSRSCAQSQLLHPGRRGRMAASTDHGPYCCRRTWVRGAKHAFGTVPVIAVPLILFIPASARGTSAWFQAVKFTEHNRNCRELTAAVPFASDGFGHCPCESPREAVTPQHFGCCAAPKTLVSPRPRRRAPSRRRTTHARDASEMRSLSLCVQFSISSPPLVIHSIVVAVGGLLDLRIVPGVGVAVVGPHAHLVLRQQMVRVGRASKSAVHHRRRLGAGYVSLRTDGAVGISNQAEVKRRVDEIGIPGVRVHVGERAVLVVARHVEEADGDFCELGAGDRIVRRKAPSGSPEIMPRSASVQTALFNQSSGSTSL